MRKETIDTWANTLALRNMYGETSLHFMVEVVVVETLFPKRNVGVTYPQYNHGLVQDDPNLSRRKRVKNSSIFCVGAPQFFSRLRRFCLGDRSHRGANLSSNGIRGSGEIGGKSTSRIPFSYDRGGGGKGCLFSLPTVVEGVGGEECFFLRGEGRCEDSEVF